MMGGFGMGFGLLGPLLMVFFWAGLVVLAAWLARALFQGSPQSNRSSQILAPTAREILDQRYARGEITREQYELMKQDIQ
jgi:putative membrane protein